MDHVGNGAHSRWHFSLCVNLKNKPDMCLLHIPGNGRSTVNDYGILSRCKGGCAPKPRSQYSD